MLKYSSTSTAAWAGLFFLFIALGALSWINMARLARGEVLSYKERDFIEAARVIGASDRRIIFIHLLPEHHWTSLSSLKRLPFPATFSPKRFLSFIGLGVQSPMPSWGSMINNGRDAMTSFPDLILISGAALALTTLAFNFFGDGLRDALDPFLRGSVSRAPRPITLPCCCWCAAC